MSNSKSDNLLRFNNRDSRGYGNLDELCNLLSGNAQFVIEKNNKPEMKSVIRFCRGDDIDEILALQKRVYDSIKDKDTFVITTREELMESLELDICIGAFHYGVLIGFTLMIISPQSNRNIGIYLNYTRPQCQSCATYDTTFIDPLYQGYGLQRIFVKLKDKIAKKVGTVEVYATVSPSNKYSLQNLEASGFDIVDHRKMYGEFDRYVLRKLVK